MAFYGSRTMIELRFHGRGGQGAVVASKAIAQAAFLAGHYVQSYPDYGVERRGAPVVAFARIAEPGDEFFVRQDIREPDHILVLDPTLLESGAPLAGLKPGGWVVVNTAILGAFAKATGIVGLDEVLEAIEHTVPIRVEENKAAATEAYEQVQMGGTDG
jgi:Pyruvate/2-oxoacid:ferredoxin oxidoreductase gamma subunit